MKNEEWELVLFSWVWLFEKPQAEERNPNSSFFILHSSFNNCASAIFHSSLFTIEKVTPILRWYCLPDSLPRHGFNPETSSRVTLASLGIAFQAGLSVLLRFRLLTVLFRLRLLRHVQNLSRITRMRRILSFSRISFNPVLPLDIWFTTDCFCAYTALDSLQQEIIRDNHSARQAQTNHNRKNKSVKEQIRRIRVIRDRFWTRRESRRRRSISIRYCLPEIKDPLLSQCKGEAG